MTAGTGMIRYHTTSENSNAYQTGIRTPMLAENNEHIIPTAFVIADTSVLHSKCYVFSAWRIIYMRSKAVLPFSKPN